ncbi:TonB family protein [Chitinibacter fontanus]|uniref:TonB family protein n=1 Tax=Chitinibacter fontanus TaxID=1737446 RepID=A0A7D5ZAJ9_9NEIS|nr:energy transducer TonB [Chitinibacter fontanus]QLI80606.1 TonB family protein [Chitinibacter fontanus]
MKQSYQIALSGYLLLSGFVFAGEGHKMLFKPMSNEIVVERTAPKPVYPAISRDLGEAGTVQLLLIVGEDGAVIETQILSASFPRLGKACAQAMGRMRFVPIVRNDTTYRFQTSIKCSFRLEAAASEASSVASK